MNLENKVLELVKEKPLLMSELEEKLGVSVEEVIDAGVLSFLRKYELAEITPTNEGGLVKITPRGLQLLNLPDLPEDELPSNLSELMEKHYGGKLGANLKTLYTPDQHAETADWITDMAIRYGVKANGVIRALWLCAKDTVWAKLKQDVKANHSFFAVAPPLVSAKTEEKR